MTESEWMTAKDPTPMLEHLRGTARASERKLRLFAVACLRQVWGQLQHIRSREAVELAERFADGQAPQDELEAAFKSARNIAKRCQFKNIAYGASWAAWSGPGCPFLDNAMVVAKCVRTPDQVKFRTANLPDKEQCRLLQDIIGNPFGPLPPLPAAWLSWNNGIVKRLAEVVYEERLLPAGTFDQVRLAVLADALEECGADAEFVAHLRGPGPHVRGCHCLDSLLGKE
jgi:hypothetical protein